MRGNLKSERLKFLVKTLCPRSEPLSCYLYHFSLVISCFPAYFLSCNALFFSNPAPFSKKPEEVERYNVPGAVTKF